VERTNVAEPLRVTAARLALATPADDALARRAEALEEDVAVLGREIKLARLLRCVRTEIHVAAVIEVKKLERVDERRLAGVVRANDLQRAGEIDLGIFVTAGLNENETSRAGGHGYLVSAEVSTSPW